MHFPFPLQITSGDGLSLRICHACISYLNSWQSFKNRCLASQSKQRAWLENSHSSDNKAIYNYGEISDGNQEQNYRQQQQSVLGTSPTISSGNKPQTAGTATDDIGTSLSFLDGISSLKKRRSLTVYVSPKQADQQPVVANAVNTSITTITTTTNTSTTSTTKRTNKYKPRQIGQQKLLQQQQQLLLLQELQRQRQLQQQQQGQQMPQQQQQQNISLLQQQQLLSLRTTDQGSPSASLPTSLTIPITSTQTVPIQNYRSSQILGQQLPIPLSLPLPLPLPLRLPLQQPQQHTQQPVTQCHFAPTICPISSTDLTGPKWRPITKRGFTKAPTNPLSKPTTFRSLINRFTAPLSPSITTLTPTTTTTTTMTMTMTPTTMALTSTTTTVTSTGTVDRFEGVTVCAEAVWTSCPLSLITTTSTTVTSSTSAHSYTPTNVGFVARELTPLVTTCTSTGPGTCISTTSSVSSTDFSSSISTGSGVGAQQMRLYRRYSYHVKVSSNTSYFQLTRLTKRFRKFCLYEF